MEREFKFEERESSNFLNPRDLRQQTLAQQTNKPIPIEELLQEAKEKFAEILSASRSDTKNG